MTANDAGNAQNLSHPSIAVNVNMQSIATLAKPNNQVNKPKRMAIPIMNSKYPTNPCINIATSGVGIINFIIASNQPGIESKIGGAMAVAASAPPSAAALAPLVVVCNHSKGILTVLSTTHESHPRPLNKSFFPTLSLPKS